MQCFNPLVKEKNELQQLLQQAAGKPPVIFYHYPCPDGKISLANDTTCILLLLLGKLQTPLHCLPFCNGMQGYLLLWLPQCTSVNRVYSPDTYHTPCTSIWCLKILIWR
jgi:hypothetical protein